MQSEKPVILFFITKSNWGGAQKYVFDLSTNNKLNDKFSPTVALGGGGALKDELEKNNVKTIKAKFLKNSLNPLTLGLSIFENIKIIRAVKPKVVHTNSSFAGLSIGVACFLLRQKSVFTVHGWPQNEDRNFLIKTILGQCMAFVVFCHSKSICVSQKVYSQTPRLFFIFDLKNKCQVIYNGINTEKQPKDFSEIFNLDKNVLNIVTIAELHSNKNYPLVLEALEKLPESFENGQSWNYHLIGDGMERENLKGRISRHKYSNKILMHGYVKDASLYLPSFDLFVLGSITEAFCYVLLEAGLAKLPCVATNVGGIPEVIEHEKTGLLVESNNREEMSESIAKLLSDKNLRQEYGENLHQKVMQNFTTKKLIENTTALYEKLLSL